MLIPGTLSFFSAATKRHTYSSKENEGKENINVRKPSFFFCESVSSTGTRCRNFILSFLLLIGGILVVCIHHRGIFQTHNFIFNWRHPKSQVTENPTKIFLSFEVEAVTEWKWDRDFGQKLWRWPNGFSVIFIILRSFARHIEELRSRNRAFFLFFFFFFLSLVYYVLIVCLSNFFETDMSHACLDL